MINLDLIAQSVVEGRARNITIYRRLLVAKRGLKKMEKKNG